MKSRVSDAACNHSPWLLGLALVQLSTHTPPPHPPLSSPMAVQSASNGVGRTIDPAEMMVSKREAVSMSVFPSSTVEEP